MKHEDRNILCIVGLVAWMASASFTMEIHAAATECTCSISNVFSVGSS